MNGVGNVNMIGSKSPCQGEVREDGGSEGEKEGRGGGIVCE